MNKVKTKQKMNLFATHSTQEFKYVRQRSQALETTHTYIL